MGGNSVNIPATLKEMQNAGEKAELFRLASPNPGQQGAPPVVFLALLKDEETTLSTITLDLDSAKNLHERLTHHIARAEQNVS